jgi:hypothetical protein
VLHPHYDRIRSLVDHRFVHYSRQCRAEGVEIERIELWHDLLEAGLAADRIPPPDGIGWEEHILLKTEERCQEILNTRSIS